jgi:hypothetical protein
VSPTELLHAALYPLPDLILAVDPSTLRIADVNRPAEALGYPKAELVALALDALLDAPRTELARFIAAADSRSIELRARRRDGGLALVSIRASRSGAATAGPCVLVVLREVPEHARVLKEIERLHGVLDGVVKSLEQLSAAPHPHPHAAAPPAEIADEKSHDVAAPWLPELTLEQYAGLCAETELHPGRIQEIHARYGLSTAMARKALDDVWSEKFARDTGMRAQWGALSARYREWFQAQQRPRVEVTAPPSQPEEQDDPRSNRVTTPPSEGRAPALPFAAAENTESRRIFDARATVAPNDVRPSSSGPLPFKLVETPDLTVEQYAALTVEIEAHPENQARIVAMYGMHSEAAWRACESLWSGRLVADPALRQRWTTLATELRNKRLKK